MCDTRARLHWPAGITPSSDLSSTPKQECCSGWPGSWCTGLTEGHNRGNGVVSLGTYSDGGGAEACWKGHPGKSNKDSFLFPQWYCPWASERWAQHMEDPQTQLCLVYSRQGTLYIAGNSIPTNVEQLAHPDETPPLNFTWPQAGKQRPSILPGCGGSSRLSPGWCGPGSGNHHLFCWRLSVRLLCGRNAKNCPRKTLYRLASGWDHKHPCSFIRGYKDLANQTCQKSWVGQSRLMLCFG